MDEDWDNYKVQPDHDGFVAMHLGTTSLHSAKTKKEAYEWLYYYLGVDRIRISFKEVEGRLLFDKRIVLPPGSNDGL